MLTRVVPIPVCTDFFPGVVLLVGLGTLIDLKMPGSLVRILLVENQIRRIPLFVIIVISQVTLNENALLLLLRNLT